MGPVKTKGFVLRVVPVGESDRIIDVLTEHKGLITVSVRGARRNKSPHLITTQLFALASFDLFESKQRFQLRASGLIHAFSKLQADLTRLVCASHLADVFVDATRDDGPQPAVYQLLAYSLYALEAEDDPLLVVHAAQLRLLTLIGFTPHLDRCVFCQTSLTPPAAFSHRAGGLVCRNSRCLDRAYDRQQLDQTLVRALRHVINAPLGQLFGFGLQEPSRQAFLALSAGWLQQQMEKHYSRLSMLDDLQAFSL